MKTTHTFSLAPMLDWTDRHFRFLCRLLSRKTRLYTEMIATRSLIYGNRDYLLQYNTEEHPLAIQLGGSDGNELLTCALMAEDYAYDEINLNIGCPSDRVQSGSFGACLMINPQQIADNVATIQSRVKLPVSIKCRTGIDHHDSYEFLYHFIDTISRAGCRTFIIHARKAWLSGLSPKQNRDIPPLEYEKVYQIKNDFPQLDIHINGGIHSLKEIQNHLNRVDGVMVGRAIYHNPWMLHNIDSQLFQQTDPLSSPHELIEQFLPYLMDQVQQGVRLNAVTRHMLGLFHGQKGAKKWRRLLSESARNITTAEDGKALILSAMKCVSRH